MYTWISTTIIFKTRHDAAETAPTTTGVKFRNDLVTLVTYHVIGSEPSVSASNRSLSVVERNQLFLTLMLLLMLLVLLFICASYHKSTNDCCVAWFRLVWPTWDTTDQLMSPLPFALKNGESQGKYIDDVASDTNTGRLESSHVLSRIKN